MDALEPGAYARFTMVGLSLLAWCRLVAQMAGKEPYEANAFWCGMAHIFPVSNPIGDKITVSDWKKMPQMERDCRGYNTTRCMARAMEAANIGVVYHKEVILAPMNETVSANISLANAYSSLYANQTFNFSLLRMVLLFILLLWAVAPLIITEVTAAWKSAKPRLEHTMYWVFSYFSYVRKLTYNTTVNQLIVEKDHSEVGRRKENEELQADYNVLEDEKDTEKESKEALQKEVDNLKANEAKLKAELEDNTRTRGDMLTEMGKLEDQIEDLEGQVESLEDRFEEQHADVRGKAAKISHLEARITGFEVQEAHPSTNSGPSVPEGRQSPTATGSNDTGQSTTPPRLGDRRFNPTPQAGPANNPIHQQNQQPGWQPRGGSFPPRRAHTPLTPGSRRYNAAMMAQRFAANTQNQHQPAPTPAPVPTHIPQPAPGYVDGANHGRGGRGQRRGRGYQGRGN